jgi:O-antigen/teichoic acid export membrane protein
MVLNAIPSYFTLSDIGFGTVAGNEMTMLVAGGKSDYALEVFQSVWVLITFLSALAALILGFGVWLNPFERWIPGHVLSSWDIQMIILLLGFSVLLSMQETLFQAAFRCVGKYALGTVSKSLISSAALLAMAFGVVIGLSPVQVAFVFMAVNAIGTFLLWLLLKKHIPWIQFGSRHAQWSTIRRLASPAISFMSFPLGNALTLQGTLIVVGAVLGPGPVVILNTARTIARSINQVMQLINNSVWPEVSIAFGAGNLGLARNLHRRACQVSILLCLSATLVIACCGNFIWKTWTVGKITTDPILLDIMLIQMLLSSLWFTSSVVPAAINKHQNLAKVSLLTSLGSLAVVWLLLVTTNAGLRGMAVTMALADVVMAMYVVRNSLLLLDDTLPDYIRSMVKLPALSNYGDEGTVAN